VWWGLGFGCLGFWLLPPTPNPQSPIPNPHFQKNFIKINLFFIYNINKKKIKTNNKKK